MIGNRMTDQEMDDQELKALYKKVDDRMRAERRWTKWSVRHNGHDATLEIYRGRMDIDISPGGAYLVCVNKSTRREVFINWPRKDPTND